MFEEAHIPEAWDALEGVDAPSLTNNVIGHRSVIDRLTSAYRDNRLHHAWLLSGPKGVGKATFAFRFAEHLLRFPNPGEAPMGFSPSDDSLHMQVARLAHPNLLSINRPKDEKTGRFKSAITIDEVRRTARFLQNTSGTSGWRICIVDCGDDLNSNAANALLKMLEEPPKQTLFLVLAHSPLGMLSTIRSRCQMASFSPLEKTELAQILSRYTDKLDFKESELAACIDMANGSVRKALMLLTSGTFQQFADFQKIIEDQRGDIGKLHQIASSLAAANQAIQYSLFMELIQSHLVTLVHEKARVGGAKARQLNPHVQVWEQTGKAVQQAEIWNLDKKQVILDLYERMRAL